MAPCPWGFTAPSCSAKATERSSSNVLRSWERNAPLRIPVRIVPEGHRADPEVFGSADGDMPGVRRNREEAAVVAGVSIQGHWLVHHRLRAQILERLEHQLEREL